MKNKEIIDILQITLTILLIILGLFIIYQIIRKIFGGSWSTENIIISLLMLNIGFTFALAVNQARTNTNVGHLSNSFRHLVNDFKLHLRDNK